MNTNFTNEINSSKNKQLISPENKENKDINENKENKEAKNNFKEGKNNNNIQSNN